MRSGVTETRWFSTAWKSVPGPASAAPPAGPIQYASSPRGVRSLITGSALCRLPRRVTSMPRRRSGAISGTFTFRSTGSPNGACARRSAILSATWMAESKCWPALLVSETASEGMPSRYPSTAAATVPE